jgi:hypothetical protein
MRYWMLAHTTPTCAHSEARERRRHAGFSASCGVVVAPIAPRERPPFALHARVLLQVDVSLRDETTTWVFASMIVLCLLLADTSLLLVHRGAGVVFSSLAACFAALQGCGGIRLWRNSRLSS